MTAITVLLGFWIAHAGTNALPALLLSLAAMAAVGFGNIVNDIHDIETDRISHPRRPLPRGELTIRQAWSFALACVLIAVSCAYAVSRLHAAAALLPIVLLGIYAFGLKATRLWGNVLVSALVAYPLIFGALLAPGWNSLIIPACLAFLLNLCREIVKDIQDREGDAAHGMMTSASLPFGFLRVLIISLSLLYVLLMPLPYALHHFGMIYLMICIVMLAPVHVWWLWIFLSKNAARIPAASLLIKLQMLGGLVALAVDELVKMLKG
jgi:geranylgeranylglycerol-phosphate geranylgeranyltransferase